MSTRSILGISLGLFLIIVISGAIQDELPRLDGAPTPDSVFIVVCDANPSQILILDEDGKWIDTIRSIELSFVMGQRPNVKCTMWSGPFKPTVPDVKVWNLAQLKSVSEDEFQQMVDSLQTDPEAVRRRIAPQEEIPIEE